ncbi:hypothetical protein ACFSKN_11215 [Mariniflexile gromovii]|uniref:Lipoprotein n=1 Tax=Mariniflexile gromovii TaxID=362523 RepID=A0ABS4BYW9_9FLAO|nr:hypothetical protein [Mariniflexile gromovii]MBP0905260.1 hypothetical protein [Mariniflexile gromovii]
MKPFLLISVCTFLLSCGSYPKKNNFKSLENFGAIVNPYFANSNQDYVYKAQIEVYNHNFGGLFIMKKIAAEQHRIVFTTEMGNTLFDFSFNHGDFKVNYILDDLNKKILINILKKDFKTLITEKLEPIETYKLDSETVKKASLDNKTYYYFENPETYKIIRVNNAKEKVRFLFTEINNNIAKRIDIVHSNIKLKITLKSIN